MSEEKNHVITVRVSNTMKKDMEKYREINWSEVIRKSIQSTLKKIEGVI
jgi:hypothetical protein